MLLGIAGESAIKVGALSLPTGQTAHAVSESDAVRLFCDRAASYDCNVAPRELGVVANLAERLDGIPLAIELAAYRMRTLSPQMLLGEISQRLDVVGRASPNGQDRHATLAGTIEWSWELLSPGEQEGLRQCGVFRGGFTLGAAQEIITSKVGENELGVVDLLSPLRDCSLLRVTVPPWFPTERRFSLFQTVRDWVHQKIGLESDAATRLLHAQHYEEYAKRWSDGAAQGVEAKIRTNIGLLEAEKGRIKEAQNECKRAVELLSSSGDDRERAGAMTHLATVTARLDSRKAGKLFRKVARLCRKTGNPIQRAQTLVFLGNIDHGNGQLDVALEQYEEALADLRLSAHSGFAD